MVFWEEEGLTSILKASQVVEPLQPKKGSKAKVKWGRRVLPATVLEIGSKDEMKKKQKEFYEKNDCNEKLLEDIAEVPPPKKKHAETTGNKKGKKGVTILCVTKPPEQVLEQNLESATPELEQELSPSPDIFRDIATPEQMLVSSPETTLEPATQEQAIAPSPESSLEPVTQAIALESPLSDVLSPEVPTQSTLPLGSATAQPVWTLELQKVFEELRAQRYTLQSIEGYVHEKLMEVQAMQDLQAARIRELQAKLENQDCQPASTTSSQDEPTPLELTPAVGPRMYHREAFRNVENLPQFHSTLPCNQSTLKSPAGVIEDNQKLLLSTIKAGRLAVKLARESYFGEEVLKESTVSSLPKEKLKEIKARLYEVYRFNNLVEFEPLWQKCLISIGKACQALRAKDSN